MVFWWDRGSWLLDWGLLWWAWGCALLPHFRRSAGDLVGHDHYWKSNGFKPPRFKVFWIFL